MKLKKITTVISAQKNYKQSFVTVTRTVRIRIATWSRRTTRMQTAVVSSWARRRPTRDPAVPALSEPWPNGTPPHRTSGGGCRSLGPRARRCRPTPSRAWFRDDDRCARKAGREREKTRLLRGRDDRCNHTTFSRDRNRKQ